MTRHSWRISPKTVFGRWSIGLLIAMPLLLFIGTTLAGSLYQSMPAGDTILEDIAGRPALALSALAGMISGILAFILGLMAIIKQKERAILVYIATGIGALITFFLIAEFLLPPLLRYSVAGS